MTYQCHYCDNEDNQPMRQISMIDAAGAITPVSICPECDKEIGHFLSDYPGTEQEERERAKARHPSAWKNSPPPLTVVPGEGRGSGKPKGQLRLVKEEKVQKPDAATFDLDGTTTSTGWRRSLVDRFCQSCKGSKPFGRAEKDPNCEECGGTGKRPNFKANYDTFHKLLPYDAPVPEVVSRIRTLHSQGMPIIFHTGRMEAQREDTEAWLNKHDVPYDELHMRADKDTRPDDDVKEEMYDEKIAPRFNVVETHDDRPKVVKMWFKKRDKEGRDDPTASNFWNIVPHEDPKLAPEVPVQGQDQ